MLGSEIPPNYRLDEQAKIAELIKFIKSQKINFKLPTPMKEEKEFIGQFRDRNQNVYLRRLKHFQKKKRSQGSGVGSGSLSKSPSKRSIAPPDRYSMPDIKQKIVELF